MNSSNPMQATVFFDDKAQWCYFVPPLWQSLGAIIIMCPKPEFQTAKIHSSFTDCWKQKGMKEAISMVPCLALVIWHLSILVTFPPPLPSYVFPDPPLWFYEMQQLFLAFSIKHGELKLSKKIMLQIQGYVQLAAPNETCTSINWNTNTVFYTTQNHVI